jgi:Uri superfamily endonuclease
MQFRHMQFTTFGDISRQGSYLLFVDLGEPVRVSFGKFMGGRQIPLDRGQYLYVGSALGSGRGSSPLASRLLRHASRSLDRPAHAIHGKLLGFLGAMGFKPKRAPAGKRLHWHVDYLLDLPEAEISHIVMVMSPSRLEHQLADLVASLPGALPVADRLGAQDAASGTHLFRVTDQADLLERLKHSFLSTL